MSLHDRPFSAPGNGIGSCLSPGAGIRRTPQLGEGAESGGTRGLACGPSPAPPTPSADPVIPSLRGAGHPLLPRRGADASLFAFSP